MSVSEGGVSVNPTTAAAAADSPGGGHLGAKGATRQGRTITRRGQECARELREVSTDTRGDSSKEGVELVTVAAERT